MEALEGADPRAASSAVLLQGAAVPPEEAAESTASQKPDWKRWTHLARAGNLSVEDWQVLHRMGFSDLGSSCQ